MANFLTRLFGPSDSQVKALATQLRGLQSQILNNSIQRIGDDVTFWHENDSQIYIDEGYNANADVFSIVSRSAAKFAQVPWYVYKVQKDGQKALREYQLATKDATNPAAHKQLKELRKKALDENIVENELSELLNRPNRNQGQDSFMEMLFGYKLLTGEGNIWLNAEDERSKPEEMFLIPKPNLLIVGNRSDPWEIVRYVLNLNGTQTAVPKENIIQWKAANYDFDAATLSHLRGQSPFRALLLALQASSAGSKREVKMYENAGVNGVLLDKTARPVPLTPTQISDLRDMISSRISGMDKLNTFSVMQGDWAWLQMGMDANQLKLIENKKLIRETLCNGLGFPSELFDPNVTYLNKPAAKKGWVYDMIAPACYSARDELNRVLLPRFGLSRDQYFIDCGVMDLPDLAEDLKMQVDAVKEAWWLSPNEKRAHMGYDESTDPSMDKVYAPSSLKPLDQLNAGEPLDSDEDLLTDNGLI